MIQLRIKNPTWQVPSEQPAARESTASSLPPMLKTAAEDYASKWKGFVAAMAGSLSEMWRAWTAYRQSAPQQGEGLKVASAIDTRLRYLGSLVTILANLDDEEYRNYGPFLADDEYMAYVGQLAAGSPQVKAGG
jgi:hypothetical protein